MSDEILEQKKAELAEKLGLGKTEPLKSTFFQGDFGYSINLTELLSILVLFIVIVFLFFYRKKKNRQL